MDQAAEATGLVQPLPAAVEAYYRRCVPEPPEAPRGTLLQQRGELRLAPGRSFMPFTAEQRCDARASGFVWHARFKMAPLVTGVVEDAYEAGCGRLDAKIWGVLPVAHGRGLEIDRGEAQRYLAELPWCPLALARNPELHFVELPGGQVRVWLHDEATHVDLRFDEAGDLVGVRTSTRSRGDVVQPWQGRFSDFRWFGPIRAPAHAEVWWETPEGPFVYFRCEILALDVDR